MPKSRINILVEKSEAAMISAIEIYNKPDYKYREETFALLAVNAWELLLKAKLAHEKKIGDLFEFEYPNKKNGERSKKKVLKRNRSGNPQTLSIWRVITVIENETGVKIDQAVKSNIEALIEIRDNAAHFVNLGPNLSKQILGFGTATVRNYLNLSIEWFNRGLSQYSLYLMPIGFIEGVPIATALGGKKEEKRLSSFLELLVEESKSQEYSDFHVSLVVDVSMHKAGTDFAIPMYRTNDPDALNIELSEEDIRRMYPWDYKELTDRLKSRYTNFKMNNSFHEIMWSLKLEIKFVRTRLLDPGNPRSPKKDFYNPNILQELDRHYEIQ